MARAVRAARAEKRPPRQRFEVDARRAQLLSLGLEAFGSRSYDDVSIDDIATQAGISKGLLYHYFTTKRGFYVEVVRDAARQLVERTQTPPDLPPLARLSVAIDAYLSFVEERALAYVALMRGQTNDPDVRAVVDATRDEFIDRLIGGLPNGVTPRQRLVLVGWIGFVEASSLAWLEHGGVDRQGLHEILSSALLALVQT